MQSKIEIVNKKNVVEINIEGTIGVPETWQFEDPQDRITTYDKFRNAVDLIRHVEAPEVVVNIRSTGGDVNDAMLMHDALMSLKGKRRTRCYGYVASAATIIAQAASNGCREISANALYLIHNSSCTAEGNADELTAQLELLRQTDERLAALYASRSGRPADEFTLLMSANNGSGRWLSPDEAIAAGLADAKVDATEVCNYVIIEDNNLINKSMLKIKDTYNAILRRLNMTAKNDGTENEISDVEIEKINCELEQADTREQALKDQLNAEKAAHQKEVQSVQDKVATLEAELAKIKAKPTETKKIEDPSVEDEVRIEGNAKAYIDDAKNLK